jgi:hypothetical protein
MHTASYLSISPTRERVTNVDNHLGCVGWWEGNESIRLGTAPILDFQTTGTVFPRGIRIYASRGRPLFRLFLRDRHALFFDLAPQCTGPYVTTIPTRNSSIAIAMEKLCTLKIVGKYFRMLPTSTSTYFFE